MTDLVDQVRSGLAAQSDPEAAGPMQRYMRSAMPFRGVAKPGRERLLLAVLAEHPPADAGELLAAARALWREAAYREERYLALGLVGHRRHAGWAESSWVEAVYRGWIVTGGWWDFTDEIASRLVGPLLRAHPGELAPVLWGWATEPDPWLRRTAVICQLGAREATDLALLAHAVEANLTDGDFFLRKGIGWALRQHARVDPGWVRGFVDAHPELAPLSRREALRHL